MHNPGEIQAALSKKAVDEYKELVRREYGVTISDAVVWEQAEKLLNLFKAIYRPLPETEC